MTRGRGLPGIVGVGLLCALTATGAPPQSLELPKLPPQPGGAVPSPLDSMKPPAALPVPTLPNNPRPAPSGLQPLPVPPVPAPRLDFPPVPALPAPDFKKPVPLAPPQPQITEPVSTVYRFKGKYLGGDDKRALVYVESGDGKAEVQSRPLATAIPRADEGAKDDVKRLEVPAGEVTYHAGRVFLTTKRELVVIDNECRADWKFTLPGKIDNGEHLLGVAGFDDGKVILASHHDAAGPDAKRTGRILAFDVASGQQTAFVTAPGGFDLGVKLLLDPPARLLHTVGGSRVASYRMDSDAPATTAAFSAVPVAHLTATARVMIATLPQGVEALWDGGRTSILPGTSGTASPALRTDYRLRFFVPSKSRAGKYSLAAVDVRTPAEAEWAVPVTNEITAAPIVRGDSVYFVAGNVVYRVTTATGTVCWKHTLALNLGEALTDLVFVGGELHASGAGVLVRVAERAEPKPSLPAGPFVPQRIFPIEFGGGAR